MFSTEQDSPDFPVLDDLDFLILICYTYIIFIGERAARSHTFLIVIHTVTPMPSKVKIRGLWHRTAERSFKTACSGGVLRSLRAVLR